MQPGFLLDFNGNFKVEIELFSQMCTKKSQILKNVIFHVSI